VDEAAPAVPAATLLHPVVTPPPPIMSSMDSGNDDLPAAGRTTPAHII